MKDLLRNIKFIISGDKVKINPRYLYKVLTWGGFYNDEHQKIHGEVPGVRYFTNLEERDAYIDRLRQIEKEQNAHMLAVSTVEGFEPFIKQDIVLHRVTEYQGTCYYTKYEVSNCHNWTFDTAHYHLEHKWYPGFNDYPMGEDFDYVEEDWAIAAEWVEGPFVNDLLN